MMNTQGCGQLKSIYTYFSNIWFNGVKTAEEAMNQGVDYCGMAKTSHKSFCLATLENLMKDWPGGSYIVMKIKTRVPGGRPLISIV